MKKSDSTLRTLRTLRTMQKAATRTITNTSAKSLLKKGVEALSAPPKKVRYAVVGLGHIAQVAVLPAFANAKNSELKALVSGDATKLRELAKRYNVQMACDYEAYDRLLESGEIDAVYIALPNHEHRDFAERAAKRGIHVLCEKPMALNTRECEAMIRAAKASKVKLMIAYRLHFEEANLKAVELATQGKLGDIRYFNSTFSMQVKPGNIRTKPEEGGGPVYDIGIYCINASRYLLRDEPIEIFAMGTQLQEKRFKGINDTVAVTMRFPKERIANFVCSFSSAATASFQLVGTKGTLLVDNSYEYVAEIEHWLTIDEKDSHKKFAKRDQFAPELIYFSDCILNNREPEPSGQEGLADLRIIDAIHKSLQTGKPVQLQRSAIGNKLKRPRLAQEIRRPAVSEPKLVKAREPSS